MTGDQRTQAEVAGDSNVGQVRSNNEDRFAIVRLECGGEPGVLALVADGVGGHVAGEVASQTVVDEITRELRADPCANPVRILPHAAIRAGRAVYERASKDPSLRGMATTLAAALLVGRRLYTVTVGDSRIYLHREGRTFQASIDHTWVEEAVEHGLLTREQARFHPNAHVLRRHLGGEQDAQPDQRLRLGGREEKVQDAEHQGLILEDGDAVVLCSDGLSDLVKEDDIGRALRHRRLERTIGELIQTALQHGGHDNITVVAVRIPKPGRPIGWLWWLILGLSIPLAAAAAAAAYFLASGLLR
jgi:serine/threonine protein phosphatase PrpC